jgi:hypothetical protein
MKLFNAIAAAVVIGASLIAANPGEAANRNRVCTFNNGYGTPFKAHMQYDINWQLDSIRIIWRDGVSDTYRLQYVTTYTDTRGDIWNLTTTSETGPTAALLYNPANNNKVT